MDRPRRTSAPTPALAAPAGTRHAVIVGSQTLSRLYLRFHVALLILWSFCCGLLFNKALLLAGVDWMVIRYPVSLLVAYGAFFVGVRLWLAYIGAAPFTSQPQRAARARTDSGVDVADLADIADLSRRSAGAGLEGGGGDFGGGGASASFGRASESALAASRAAGVRAGLFSGGSAKGSGSFAFDLGDGDGWLIVLLLALAAALLCSVFGAVVYIVYSAPTMLADVAFSAMLAGGLVKSSRRWRDASWKTELLSATWIPFTIVFVLALLTAALAMHVFPAARTLSELIHAAIAHLG